MLLIDLGNNQTKFVSNSDEIYLRLEPTVTHSIIITNEPVKTHQFFIS